MGSGRKLLALAAAVSAIMTPLNTIAAPPFGVTR
jgi:hypothetical protein